MKNGVLRSETDTYCRVCGQNNAPGAAICDNCGAPLGRGRQSFTGPYLDPNDKLDGISLADWAAYMGPSAPVSYTHLGVFPSCRG